MANIFGMVKKALTKAVNPNDVEEVLISNFEEWPVKRREDCLQLKGPHYSGKPGTTGVKFEAEKKDEVVQVGSFVIIVLSSTNLKYCYRVLTTTSLTEADRLFDSYQRILPAFLSAKPDMCNKGSLQKLCDSAREHPDWGLCHIAVHLDMIDLVASEDHFKREMNNVDSAGVTAIMVAVNTGSKHLVTGLVDNGADLKAGCDVVGNNVMHYIAEKSVLILDLVTAGKHYKSEVIVELLNKRNNDNKTPLHIASDQDKPDLVLAMLKLGADFNVLATAEDVPDQDSKKTMTRSSGTFKDILTQFPKGFYEKDIRFGGTPLHWAADKGAMDALIQLGCDMEARNNYGDPAVHKMISHKRLSCLVVLLSYGADVNSRDANGDTPLHIAMQLGHIPSIQALVVFNADYNLKNKDGDSPWMIALKTHQAKFSNVYKDIVAERNMMLHTLHSIGANGPSDINNSEDFDWSPPINDNNRLYKRPQHSFDEFMDRTLSCSTPSPGDARVLCLDGGGIRGLVLAKMLECVCNVSGQSVPQMFDWISGTSTGGILALALALNKTPIECQSLYFKLKDKVFVGGRPYNVEPLEEFLKAEFTENLMMSNLPKKPYVAVTATIGDRFPPDLHLFRNYESPMDLLGLPEHLPPGMPSPKKPDQQSVWRAARSSGAAPSYFRASGRYIDGGLVANNPTLDILTEINERNLALKSLNRTSELQNVGIVVSLGTGEPPLEKQLPPDIFLPTISPMSAYQSLQGASSMARMLVEQACSATNRVVDRARSWCSMANISFFRLSPLLAKDIDLDTTDDVTLVEMLWMTQSYMHQNRSKIKQIVEILNKCSSVGTH